MREKKVIKKEQQQLLRKLSDLYREHGFIRDHEVETSKECLLCEDIRAWKMIIERLDHELEEFRIANLDIEEAQIEQEKVRKIRVSSTSKKEKAEERLQTKATQPQWKIFLVVTKEGGEYFYRVKSKKKVQEEVALMGESVKNSGIRMIEVEKYKKIYLERNLNDYVSLEVLDKAEQEGLLGKKGVSKEKKHGPHKCRRKIVEEVMVYDGENSGAVITFCQPFEAKRTKKGNKIQLNTSRGSQAIAPFDYVVKFGKRIELYTTEEFHSIFTVDEEDDKVWITID